MATPTPDIYTFTPGTTLYAGLPTPAAPELLQNVTIASEDAGVPHTTADQTFVFNLHASGGSNTTTGRQYRADVSGELAYDTHDEFSFSTVRGVAALGFNLTLLRPVDDYGTYPSAIRRESYWLGFTGMGSTDLKLITERRLDALLDWAKTNVPNCSPTRRVLTGGSMGAWGTITYGLRRPTEFPAIYPDRPRWRYSGGTNVNIPNYPTGAVSVAYGSAPNLAAEDGGGSAAVYMDGIAYVSNTANAVPWVGWCIGRNDGFAPFSDSVAAVAALRAAKRGFCFVWNDGNHTTGSILSQITASYPFGTFELGKGYPLFTNHSGDADPAVDLVGGINEGLSFRNVVESAGSWSCEVTSVLGARTVTVEPISGVFTGTVVPEVVTIPAANTWVSVSFASAVVPNEMRISSVSGTQTNYPYQFGRPFRLGEIANFPQVLINGTPVTTQADVKTRHTDGSVKFAVISIVVPSLPTTETVLTFQNQASIDSTPETKANMLANYDFEATIGIAVDGTPITDSPVSARSMLTALSDAGLAAETAAGGADARYWTQGPICTTVLLHNHTSKTWDVGTNATKAIRPMFIVQFWPTLGKYHVRHIIEGADCTKLKDELNLDITFTVDFASPVTKLTQTNAYLYAATWQSRAYWGGTDVPRCNAKHGVAYLSDTRTMPNYDPSIEMNSAAIASYASDWAGKSKALNQAGYWQKAMATTGGRPDIGLMPKWDSVALYSGVAHMHEIGEVHAELAGSWGMYFREGSDTKTIFGAQLGEGRIISKLSRPTQFMVANNGQMVTTGVDGFTTDGVLSTARDGWAHDEAHTPGAFWFQYLTTGSAFWHEKLIQMAAWSQFFVNPGFGYNNVANGATNTDLIMNGVQPRGYGWQMRNRARAWWAALDGSGEKSLFDKSLTDAVAHRTGILDVPGHLVGNTIRDAWNTNYATWYGVSGSLRRPNALQFFEGSQPYTVAALITSAGAAPDDMDAGQAPWMRNYVSMCLYHAAELGATVCEPLADWTAHQTILIANGSEPRHIADFIAPATKTGGAYYQTLADVYDGWAYDGALSASDASGFPGAGAPNTFNVTVELFGSISAATIAMANGAPDRDTAWAFVEPYHNNTVFYNHDPRFAIIPRA